MKEGAAVAGFVEAGDAARLRPGALPDAPAGRARADLARAERTGLPPLPEGRG
jgi:hypothetical protein